MAQLRAHTALAKDLCSFPSTYTKQLTTACNPNSWDPTSSFSFQWDRQITHKLYGGDWENRIKQEYLLGIGGVLMLEKLGIKTDLYHANEGHAALMNLQRLVDYCYSCTCLFRF